MTEPRIATGDELLAGENEPMNDTVKHVKKTQIREVEVSTIRVQMDGGIRFETVVFNFSPERIDNPEYHDSTEEQALATHDRVVAALELLGLPWPKTSARLAWIVSDF